MEATVINTWEAGFRTGHFKEFSKYRVSRPKGQRDWLLLYTVDGTGFFRYPKGKFAAHPGCAVLIPPGLPHDYGLQEEGLPWDFLWAHFEPRAAWGTLLDWPTLPLGLRTVQCPRPSLTKAVKRTLQEMNQVFHSNHPRTILKALNALERALLLLDEANPSSVLMHRDERVQGPLDHITGSIRHIQSVRDVALHTGLSESRLSHLFKEQTGLTVVHFIEKTRLARARDYLELTQRPVSEIASLVGYRDPFYFSKRFHRAHGQSPQAFRRERRRRKSAPQDSRHPMQRLC